MFFNHGVVTPDDEFIGATYGAEHEQLNLYTLRLPKSSLLCIQHLCEQNLGVDQTARGRAAGADSGGVCIAGQLGGGHVQGVHVRMRGGADALPRHARGHAVLGRLGADGDAVGVAGVPPEVHRNSRGLVRGMGVGRVFCAEQREH